MQAKPRWLYDEMKHAGVDYGDPAQAAVYDERHQRFRDYRAGAEAIIAAVGIRPEHTVIDMGAGTGAFALHAAPHCRTVYAVDVSQVMLDCARRKAQAARLTNIVFCQGGFLTYEHQAAPADVLVSVSVLHHLPDLWKLVALRRAARMLVRGGRLYLFDIVFPAAVTDLEAQFDELVDSMGHAAGPDFAAEAETHLRDEYSTYEWVMEGLLERSGFHIEGAEHGGRFNAAYLCTRTG